MVTKTKLDKLTVVGRERKVNNYWTPVTGKGVQTTERVWLTTFAYKEVSKSWIQTPGFGNLKRTHAPLPDNAFSWSSKHIALMGGVVQGPLTPLANGGWEQTVWTFTGPCGPFAADSSPSSNLTAVKFKLIEAAKGNQWNVPIFLAEGRKTVEMVVDAATRMTLMVRALRRGRFDDFVKYAHPENKTRLLDKSLKKRFGRHYAKDPRGAAANYWLQLTYGWSPFMMDVKSAVNTLCDLAEKPDSLDGTVRATSKEKPTLQVWVNDPLFLDSVKVNCTYYRQITVSYRAVWRFTMKPQDIPGRLGLLNPAEVIWELVPFSFVADWFLPIGDYLAALDVPLRFTHRGGTYGRKAVTKNTAFPTKVTYPVGGTILGGFDGTSTYTSVSRTPMTSLPSVSLADIGFDPKLGVSRVTSAIALLHQVLGKLK